MDTSFKPLLFLFFFFFKYSINFSVLISRITLRVRNLLLLIPTDPEVQDALDNFVPKESSVWSHQVGQSGCALKPAPSSFVT